MIKKEGVNLVLFGRNNEKSQDKQLDRKKPTRNICSTKKKPYRTPFESNHTCPDFLLGCFFLLEGKKGVLLSDTFGSCVLLLQKK
mmetsp:Transcript_52337/g.60435  ORF Transcript_52337/g.60435 Transcript_52337/m.60435 type:complete len:85 (-) Transcript_52337:120-374(-)